MYINFQQNWVSRSVKTVRTNIFANNCKLHKFVTIPIGYIFKSITSDIHHHKSTYISIRDGTKSIPSTRCIGYRVIFKVSVSQKNPIPIEQGKVG